MKKNKPKYIFVIGGIMSGIGKGVVTSSIGTILTHHGYSVNLMKVDPYLNVDAGTMSPTEHGEVFVLESGLETDQDMGNYERFLNRNISPSDYITSGMVYKTVIEKERSFGYEGKCVEAIPHVVDEIRSRIEKSAKRAKADVQVIEIGGTLGDYQNLLFLEAARQMHFDTSGGVLFILVSYLPFPKSIGEVKTRPTQNAVRTLHSYGIHPSIIIARSEGAIDAKRKEKIARACGIPRANIIPAPDVESIYDIPANFEKAKVSSVIINELSLPKRKSGSVLTEWRKFNTAARRTANKKMQIGIVGKYFETGAHTLSDSYLSIIEAVRFSCAEQKVQPEILWLNTKQFEDAAGKKEMDILNACDALIIPGGFGLRGVDEKIAVIQYARKKKIPLLGICYGMQLMVVEYMRSVVGKRTAHTTEIDPETKYPVIAIMDDQKKKIQNKEYGGSMRLGGYKARIKKSTLVHALYGRGTAIERHRHRYEVNNAYLSDLQKKGLIASAYSDTGLVETVELADHPFFVGCQYHPEFLARPLSPHPLFTGLIQAAKKQSK